MRAETGDSGSRDRDGRGEESMRRCGGRGEWGVGGYRRKGDCYRSLGDIRVAVARDNRIPGCAWDKGLGVGRLTPSLPLRAGKT